MVNWIEVKDYAEMSEFGAAALYDATVNAFAAKGGVNLGLATGNTMIDLYTLLARRYHAARTDLKRLKTFNLDEYVGRDGQSVPVTHPLSYLKYMTEKLFSKFDPALGFDVASQAFFPSGADPEAHDRAIRGAGGLDLQLLGIGFNGHIAFNEPMSAAEISAAAFAKLPSRVIRLTDLTIATNARLTANGDATLMPLQAATQGMATILEAKKVLLLACFAEQEKPLKAIKTGKRTPELPASLLLDHPDCTFVYTADKIKLS